VAKAEEIIRISKDRKTIIERLLAENYGEEVWSELISSNPDLATKQLEKVAKRGWWR
jgi:hypothetical protein